MSWQENKREKTRDSKATLKKLKRKGGKQIHKGRKVNKERNAVIQMREKARKFKREGKENNRRKKDNGRMKQRKKSRDENNTRESRFPSQKVGKGW